MVWQQVTDFGAWRRSTARRRLRLSTRHSSWIGLRIFCQRIERLCRSSKAKLIPHEVPVLLWRNRQFNADCRNVRWFARHLLARDPSAHHGWSDAKTLGECRCRLIDRVNMTPEPGCQCFSHTCNLRPPPNPCGRFTYKGSSKDVVDIR